MKRYYKNSDFNIYWNISKNGKNKLISLINDRYGFFISDWINDFIKKNKLNKNNIEININVYKDSYFFDRKTLSKSEGILVIESNIYYGECGEYSDTKSNRFILHNNHLF